MNEFHLLQSWTPTRGKELTKRQADRLLKKLKTSKMIQFKDSNQKDWDGHYVNDYCVKLRLRYGREPRDPPAKLPTTTNQLRRLEPTCSSNSLAWNGMTIESRCSDDDGDGNFIVCAMRFYHVS